MNVNVPPCVKEREVKESVRIELVKALHQARFILTERDIARSGFITTDTNVTATFVATTPRPSTKQCKFCDKAGHVESECYTKQNLEKFRHKMVSAVTVEQEPTVSKNGHW
jgi:hypothetical protein